jgi:hypothetical protein
LPANSEPCHARDRNGFTGTPLLKKDRQTSLEVFGGYVHTYKFSEAVEDARSSQVVSEIGITPTAFCHAACIEMIQRVDAG